ncbi:helix-turn-helix transcriptional regulator [Chloroflexota bacterium]
MEPLKKIIIHPSFEWEESAKELGVSHRELEVFALLFEGHNNKEIAAILGIQHQSVKNHLYSLSKKLKVKNVAQALGVLLFKNMVRMEIPFLKGFKFTQESAFREFQKRVFDDTDHTFTDKQKRNIRSVMVELGIYGDMFKDRKNELDEENI